MRLLRKLNEIDPFFRSFWERNPALFLGLAVLLGTASAFKPHLLLFLLLALLLATFRQRSMLVLAALFFAAAWASAPLRHPRIDLGVEKLPGTARFHIDNVKWHSSPFHKSILYKGTLERFEADDGSVYTDLPCSLFLPARGNRPSADKDYLIAGSLCQMDDYHVVLKPNKKVPWEPLASSLNGAERRFQAKQTVAKILKKEIADPKARTLLIALATGEIDERILTMEFGKVGVQHILAVSGFHFAIAALFLNFLFRLVFPYRISAALLILSLFLYYLYLGDAPSIRRAFIAIGLVAAGQLFSFRISGLNALGIGLLCELITTPLAVLDLGFQLSFLCTLGILLLYTPMQRAVSWFFPMRTLSQMRALSLFEKHGCLLSSFLRQMLALNLAVHIVSLPVLLHLFHKFPLLSLAYNLFFPACVSLSMLLMLAAFIFTPIPIVSHFLHTANNAWTSASMFATTNPPALLDYSLRANTIAFSAVLCALAICFFAGIYFYERELLEKKAL